MQKDWTGIEQTKRFFSNKEFIWFDTKSTLRAENALSEKDRQWLRGFSFAPFGVASLFYFCSRRRRLSDIAFAAIAYFVYDEVHDAFIKPLFISEESSAPAVYDQYVGLYLFFQLSILICALWFTVVFPFTQSRRLAWNRGNWKDFQEFRASEHKWFWWNFVPSLLLICIALSVLLYLKIT